jgi:hypothetical protein
MTATWQTIYRQWETDLGNDPSVDNGAVLTQEIPPGWNIQRTYGHVSVKGDRHDPTGVTDWRPAPLMHLFTIYLTRNSQWEQAVYARTDQVPVVWSHPLGAAAPSKYWSAHWAMPTFSWDFELRRSPGDTVMDLNFTTVWNGGEMIGDQAGVFFPQVYSVVDAWILLSHP